MKKIFLVFIVWLSSIPCFAHEPWVHQYIVQEAYRYLEKQVGAIPVLRHYTGIDFYGTNQPYWGPGDVPRPWELELGIPVGVWREDVYDPIWRFSGGYTTISHFWSADNGDDAWTDFTGGITTSNPNAWEKARRFYFGGDRLAGLPRPFSHGTGINLDGDYRYTVSKGKYNKANFIDVSYNSLCDLIANRNSTITAYYYIDLLSASKTTFSQPEDFNSQRSRLLGFHVLGHLLHLLTDGSVPAHTHRDTHVCPIGDGDTYETAMGRNDFIDLGDCTKPQTSFLAQNWTAITAAKQGGLLLEVFSMSDEDALRYMFYTMNQLANHFGTNDFAGNDDLPNGSSMLVSARYSLLSTTGTSTYGWQNGTFNNTPSIVNYAGDELMNYAIRVSATMMYWIALKTGLVGCPTTLYQQSHTYYGVRTASENANFKASSKIIAGRNVHPNLTSSQGNVVVESGTLTYLAGDEIQLRDGFVAKVGSNFHARIENVCPLTTSCINSTSSIQDESIPLVNQGATEKIENFAKKGDTPTIQSTSDTVQKCSLYIPNEAVVTTSGDTVFITDWLKTDAVRRPNDTSTSDGHGVVDPIWIYTDSLIVYRIVDTIIRDTIVLTYDYISTIYLDDSTSNVIIVKSDTSGTARYTGNDFAPRIHSIYPNPNSDYIDLQVDGMGSAATVTIYSQMGVQLSETTVGSSEKLSRVSTSGLAPGMYMAVIKTAKGRTSKNFIVNR